AGLSGRAGWRRVHMSYALYALLLAQWVYVATWGTRAATITRAFLETRMQYGAPADFETGSTESASAGHLPRAIELMTRHQVLLHQDLLQDWQGGRSVAVSDTGLFRCNAPSR